MYQLKFVLFILVFCLVPTVGLQAVVVRGTVVDGATDKSLPNITVKLLNSRVGTSTNIYGHFQINAISTDSLQFSSVGYETMVPPSGCQRYHISHLISEVVPPKPL